MAAFLQAWDKRVKLPCPVQLLLMDGNQQVIQPSEAVCTYIYLKYAFPGYVHFK